jgi:hypothetical protein
MKNGNGTYRSTGQVSEPERIKYYKSVIKFLCRLYSIRYQEEDLDVVECRILIDELLGNY